MTLFLAAATYSVHETEKLVSFTLVELLVILAAARLAAKTARLLGQPRVVGEIVMNTRALMELIVINVGFDLDVIPPNVFTMLVFMAIFSTVITAPFMRLYFRKIGFKYELHSDV